VYENGVAQPGKSLFVLHHGGGLSALSWATTAVRGHMAYRTSGPLVLIVFGL